MCVYNVNEKNKRKIPTLYCHNITSLETKFSGENDNIQKKNDKKI